MIQLRRTDLFKVKSRSVDIDFELKDGINLLLGKNGIGKSSFMRFAKENTDLFKPYKIAFMDQFPLKPITNLRGEDILQILKEEIPLFNEGLLNQLVEDFNFKSLLSKEVNLLSGGENQILKFILLFCQSADVYALDEPLQYLDGENLNKILKYILDISNEKVLLIIEHKRDIFKDLRCHEILMEELEHRIVIGERFGI